jgi:hypothetical protein
MLWDSWDVAFLIRVTLLSSHPVPSSSSDFYPFFFDDQRSHANLKYVGDSNRLAIDLLSPLIPFSHTHYNKLIGSMLAPSISTAIDLCQRFTEIISFSVTSSIFRRNPSHILKRSSITCQLSVL